MDVLYADLVNLINNMAFPVAVSVYLLVRLETRLDVLTSAIDELRTVIGSLKLNPLSI